MKNGLALLLLGGAAYAAYKYGLFGSAATSSTPAAPSPGGIVPATTPMPTLNSGGFPPAPSTPRLSSSSTPASAGPDLASAAASCAATGGRWSSIAQYCIPTLSSITAATPHQDKVDAATAVMSRFQLLSQLIQAGGVQKHSVDEWNFYLNQLVPSATVTDLGVVRDASDAFYANEYLDLRTAHGLSGLAAHYGASLKRRGPRTMVHTTRRNYVRRIA